MITLMIGTRILIILVAFTTRFMSLYSFSVLTHYQRNNKLRKRSTLKLNIQKNSGEPLDIHIKVVASAGLTKDELPIILSSVRSTLDDNFGMQILTHDSFHDINPAIPSSVPGALGRVLLLSLENVDWDEDDERLDPFKYTISNKFDTLIGTDIEQPIILSIIPNFRNDINSDTSGILNSIIEREVMKYDLRKPMSSSNAIGEDKTSPTIHVEIDGAMVPDPYLNVEKWDTSSVLVFDDFVDTSLRMRLLDVINKRDENYDWDDRIQGPDPKRWERGGLQDTFDDESEPCWGLTEEATNDLCFEEHCAILDVEQKICNLFSPHFVVTRLPEAVLGPYVSPLTANAPTFGDTFAYHIDADPNQVPPCELWKLLLKLDTYRIF